MHETEKTAVAQRPRDESQEETDAEVEASRLDIYVEDHETLVGEEEAERLLGTSARTPSGAGGLGAMFRGESSTAQVPDKRRARRKDKWRKNGDGVSELLYKVEEGGPSSSAESLVSSNGVDLRRQRLDQRKVRESKRSCCCRFAAIYVLIVIAFVTLLYGAYKASHQQSSSGHSSVAKVLSNGTHEFAPTTILISLDGFRADFLHRGLTPALSSLIKQGVSPKYMRPSFPSLTFPNHFTLVTGMYPESHGIVGNTFWDPNLQQSFSYMDPEHSMRPEFWNAEPLWETAGLQGMPAAIHMWPGSEAHIGGKALEPAYLDEFNGREALDVKVNRILHWLDIPGPKDKGASKKFPRPQFIAAYVPNVDADGHAYGPNSTYIRSTIAEVDGMLGSLFQGIDERNLTDIVNVVIVSDHGMATTSTQRLIQLDDLIDRTLIEHIDGWPLYGLRLVDQSQEHLMSVYEQLLQKAEEPQFKGNFDVYLRGQNMPERYHFSNNDRIAPLWLVPQTGWAIVTKDEFDIEAALQKGESYHLRGLHGYDHEHPLMRAIFIARGPAFPHPAGSQIAPFQNIELYNIVCDSLGLDPSPNNGTVRLPFLTTGLHDFTAQGELYDDFTDTDIGALLLPPDLPGVANLPPVGSDKLDDLPAIQPDPLADGAPMPARPSDVRPVVEDGGAVDENDPSWLDWIKQKLEDAKVWTVGLFGGGKDEANPGNKGD